MSSSRPSSGPARAVPRAVKGRGRLRRWYAGWPLRTRLIAVMIVLLGIMSVITGVTTQVWLRSFLIGQLDSRLSAAGLRAAGPDAPPGQDQGQRALFPPGQDAWTVGARIVNGKVTTAGYLDANGIEQALPAADFATLTQLPVDSGAYTRRLDVLGNYRLQAHRVAFNGDITVTGLPLTEVDNTLANVVLVELSVAGAGMLVAGLTGAVIVRRTLRPLRRVAATASRVSEMPLDRGEVALSVRVPAPDTDTRTEVGQVGAALNRMLGHVGSALRARQASEMRVRQFVADASHELRTPLAAIRGYAELTRRFGDEVPGDVAYAMRRVESESVRMTTMVNDLLLLARLDSNRPLEHEPVDLSQLVVDAVSDAHVAGPEHIWRLELPAAPVTVSGDPTRLHQVLANLLTNARTHTQAGTTVRIGLSGIDGQATLRVADNGPGIPEDLLPDVFDRFTRGDTSRSRAAGSTGLGLAIVAAVVAAHHGSVAVESRPGQTVFTVTLPASNGSASKGSPA